MIICLVDIQVQVGITNSLQDKSLPVMTDIILYKIKEYHFLIIDVNPYLKLEHEGSKF